MKKNLLYISILFLLGLYSCSNNNDEPPKPTPPVTEVEGLTADAIIGTWETYYSEKQIIANYDTQPSSYGGLRNIDYDGFKTRFYKNSKGEYKIQDYNAVGDLIYEIDYKILGKDTIKLDGTVKDKNGEDSTINTYFKVWDFKPTNTTLTIANIYTGVSKANNVKYKITDSRRLRNMETAPTTTVGVTPAKVMIDYDDLCKGLWHIQSYSLYYDGSLQNKYSDLITDTLSMQTYKFYRDKDGDKAVQIRTWNYNKKEWGYLDCPLILVDDLINYFYSVEKKDASGKTIIEDVSIYIWFTKPRQWNGKDSYIDLKESRYDNDVRVVTKTEMLLVREDDDYFPPQPK
ncbi:MAG: hypothetical protein LBV43_05310 [Prevotella sp.]|jgi:hypothetical protein|nr:hypothetical protein [Prevotella sp.]